MSIPVEQLGRYMAEVLAAVVPRHGLQHVVQRLGILFVPAKICTMYILYEPQLIAV